VKPDWPFGPGTLISRNEEPVAVEADRTVVMMSVEQGMYFGLEGVGGRIWALLERPRTFAELCESLVAEFQVDPEVCRKDVGAFLQEMLRARLVRLNDP
jgi:hypothetical protein